MKRTVYSQGQYITYTLSRKDVRNINLRVTRGEVRVSAPGRAPAQVIDRFVIKKARWIIRAVERQNTDAGKAEPGIDSIRYLGRVFPVRAQQGPGACYIDNGIFIVSAPVKPDAPAIARHIQQWRQGEMSRLAGQVMGEYYPAFARMGVKEPRVTLRRMKTRWGSCRLKTHAITLNTRLLDYPIECLRYVAAHELCHFIHPNHSEGFYALLRQIEPNYPAYRALLKA